MNIFVLDSHPKLAAAMHCDKHVVKMTTEAAQMVSTTMRLCFPKLTAGDTTLYKVSYPQHPCNVWARKGYGHLAWLLAYGRYLGEEYNKRYGKVHKALGVVEHACKLLDEQSVEDWLAERDACGMGLGGPRFPLCMPDKYKEDFTPDANGHVHVRDAVEAYRRYYLGEKASFAKWKNTSPPSWWPNVESR